MTVLELKNLLNSLPTKYDDLNVWLEGDYGEGGKPLTPEQIKIIPFHLGDFDLDEGCEALYVDEIVAKYNLPYFPPTNTEEFKKLEDMLAKEGYSTWDESDIYGIKFNRDVLSIFVI